MRIKFTRANTFGWAIRHRWIWTVLLMSMAAYLHVKVMPRQPLWVDEIFSLAIATGHSIEHPAAAADPSMGDFVESEFPVTAAELGQYLDHGDRPAGVSRIVRASFLSDTHPPTYYLLLNLWTRWFGTSDAGLRSFSIIWAVASIPLVVAIGRHLGGIVAAAGAGTLYVFSPMSVYYSTEGRMYSLLLFSVLLTVWISLLIHRHQSGLALKASWGAASAVGLLIHYFFIFPWAATVVFLWFSPGSLRRLHLGLCLAVVVVLTLPWYLHLPETMHAWKVTQDWINWRPHGFDRLRSARALVLQCFSGDGQYLWKEHRTAQFLALGSFATVGIAWFGVCRLRVFAGGRLLIWLWFAAACAGPLVFDLLRHSYTAAIPRYALTAVPAACLLGGLGLARLNRLVATTLGVVIVLAWVPSVKSIYWNPNRNDLPFREISAFLEKDRQASDLVMVHSIPSGILNVARYAKPDTVMATWVEQLGTRRVPDSLQRLAAGKKRILFVKLHTVGAATPEEDWLRAHATLLHEQRMGLSWIADFRPKLGGTF